MAIISSYGEMCGNATYAEALRRGFSKYFAVKVFALPVKLFYTDNKLAIQKSRKIIQQYAEELKTYDLVNIQFEVGLYGVNYSEVIRNFLILAGVVKNTVITIHRFDIKVKVFKNFFPNIVKFGVISVIKELRNCYNFNKSANVYERVFW